MPPLTKLSFFNFQISSDDFLACLEGVPRTLVELHVEGGTEPFINDSVLAALTYTRPDEPARSTSFLCPWLERIRIRGHIFAYGMSGSAMINMLESRFRQPFPVPGLSRLKWAFVGGNYDEDEWKQVEPLEEDGLDLLAVEEGEKYLPRYVNDPELFE